MKYLNQVNIKILITKKEHEVMGMDEKYFNYYKKNTFKQLINNNFSKFEEWFNNESAKYLLKHYFLICDILQNINTKYKIKKRRKLFKHFWSIIKDIKIPIEIKMEIISRFPNMVNIWYCNKMRDKRIINYMIYNEPKYSYKFITSYHIKKYIVADKFLNIYKNIHLKNKQYIYDNIKAIKLLKEI